MTDDLYPPVSFSFSVSIDGISGANEGNFQEVSGLQAKLGTEEVKEGGENRFVLRLPTPPKYENLVLKRGMLDISSPLIAWARQGVESFTFSPKTVLINLLKGGRRWLKLPLVKPKWLSALWLPSCTFLFT